MFENLILGNEVEVAGDGVLQLCGSDGEVEAVLWVALPFFCCMHIGGNEGIAYAHGVYDGIDVVVGIA